MRAALRPLLLCAAALVLPAAAGAGPWHVGARTGLALTNIHGAFPELVSPDYQTSFQGGGFVAFAPAGPVGVVLEAIYIQKGATFKSLGTDDQGNFTGVFEEHLRLRYLEVPVLARVSLPGGGRVEPFAVLGPTFGIALGGTFDSEVNANQDVGSDLQRMDAGATVGLGARLGGGRYRWLVETRYFSGFNDLWDVARNLESINHGFGLTLGVER